MLNTQELLQSYLHDANAENASGTHRGVVLVWASIVDDVLLRILKAHFVEMNGDQRDALFGPLGPVGSFSSKTKICFAMGLIARDEMVAIDELRSIRNKFAHKIGVDLTDEELVNRCLSFGSMMTGERMHGDPKHALTGGCGSLLMLLINRLGRVTRCTGLSDERPLPDRAYGT